MNSYATSEDRPWYSGITGYQWLVLLIASLGWIFDVFEGQIFVACMNEAMPDLLGPSAGAGLVSFYNSVALAAFLVGGAIGGVAFGMLSDRVGRVRTMILTILVYSIFTFFQAFTRDAWQLIALRFLVAMGIGGEWAVASSMVAEVFPKHARAWSSAIFHASSVLGIWIAAAVGILVVANPALGWRWAFVIGVLPALLTVWVYRSLREPEQWTRAREAALAGQAPPQARLADLFTPALLRNSLVGLALATFGLATFWAVYIQGWNLMRELAAKGLINWQPKSAEMMAMFLVSTGGGIGLVSCGPLCNRLGRRATFLFFCLGGLVSALLLFQVVPLGPLWVLWPALPVFGYFTTGMHAGYAIYFPELFPTRLRGTGSGFCFNGGRLLAAPILIVSGWMQKDLGMSLSDTASVLSLLFLAGAAVLLFAPETKGKDLPT